MTKPKMDKNGYITNAGDLTANQVANQKVLCPAGCGHPFEKWPCGWDRHAESPRTCNGVADGNTEKKRKRAFKEKYLCLFHNQSLERYR